MDFFKSQRSLISYGMTDSQFQISASQKKAVLIHRPTHSHVVCDCSPLQQQSEQGDGDNRSCQAQSISY